MSDGSTLAGRRIVVGVSGGIAAYKAAELVRLLVKAGAEVRCVMTEAAEQFITPLTLQALSQHPVATRTFDLTQEATIGHIELADLAEVLVIAPATADVMARLATGMANDLLTTVALACKAPLLLAPAMNVNMWSHPATQANLATLRARGAHIVGPGQGELACGWVGSGRMSEPVEVVAACAALLGPGDLAGRRVLVTAGGTREAVDPVRYLGNRSTGKMGFAVARAAARRGAEVVLVAAGCALETPPGVTRVDVESAREMHEAVMTRADAQSVIVMTAAVADYRPRTVAAQKLKKESLGESPTIALERNPDILAELGTRPFAGARPLLVGFAAETDDVERRAVEKRRQKACDLLVANDVSEAGSGFGTDTNRVLLVDERGVEALPLLSKDEVAGRLLDWVRALAGRSSMSSDELLALSRQVKEYLAWLERGGVRGVPPAPVAAMPTRTAARSVPSEARAPAPQRPAPVAPAVTVPAAEHAPNAPGVGAARLAAVREELGDCSRCKLSGGRQNLVYGVGNPDASLVFVGEAPGAEEDRTGEPFVGAAGQLLTKMIGAMGFGRDDVYICNIIKCRPPGNRNPEPDEITACEPFLKKQLAAIRPRMIVCLGKFAAQCLLRSEAPISKLRGQFHTYEGIPLMPTFHPAFLLRNPAAKREVWQDLQSVMAELERLGLLPPR